MYSNQNSTTSLKSFNVLQKLGEGSFASVYKVQRIDDKKIYAMKKVKIGQMKQKERDNALNQVRVLASISHPNIVNYKQAFFDVTTESLCIVMQFADAGDIQKKINQHIKGHTFFNEIEIWQAFIQMAKGLKALHQINILHRDLKCANVFCTKDNKYKLGDLNVSKVAKRGMARTQTGTPYYTSPQVWKDQPYDSKCDIWSLGCVIYQMAALSPPFRASNLKQLYTKIQRGIFQRIPSFYSEDLVQMINMCLKVNPAARPSALEILQNPRIEKNMPTSQKYALDNDHTKKVNLINTILCPRNLKSLKMALPGAKYEQQQVQQKNRRPGSVQINRSDNGSQRSISSRNNNIQRPINELPRVINSPKQPQSPNINRYAINRRPSQRNILPIFVNRQKSSREKSLERQRSLERERQRQKQRQRSRQRERLLQENNQNSNNSRQGRNGSKLVRNYSADLLKKRRQSSRSVQINSSRKKQQRSIQKKDQLHSLQQNVQSKCRNIKQRIQKILANQQRLQPVQQLQRRYLIQLPNSRNSNQKKQTSAKNSQEKSRNSNSRELRNYYPNVNPSEKNNADRNRIGNLYGNVPASQRVSNGSSQRPLQKNFSSERIGKQERSNSRKIFELPKPSPYLYYRR